MNRLDSQLVKKRTEQLHVLVKKISNEQNLNWKNWRGSILVDELTTDALIGRNFAYKPIFFLSPNVDCQKSWLMISSVQKFKSR